MPAPFGLGVVVLDETVRMRLVEVEYDEIYGRLLAAACPFAGVGAFAAIPLTDVGGQLAVRLGAVSLGGSVRALLALGSFLDRRRAGERPEDTRIGREKPTGRMDSGGTRVSIRDWWGVRRDRIREQYEGLIEELSDPESGLYEGDLAVYESRRLTPYSRRRLGKAAESQLRSRKSPLCATFQAARRE